MKNRKYYRTILVLFSVIFVFLVVSKQEEIQTTISKAMVNPENVSIVKPLSFTSGKAKALLESGNKRFVDGKLAKKDLGIERRKQLVAGQYPFAIIVCCSDSRVPPEIIFDQGLGDLFVVRVAGNVVGKIEIGSVEYGVEYLKVPLVVVLGHQNCGAVEATIKEGEANYNIGAIVKKIMPSFEKVRAEGFKGEELLEQTINQNIISVTNTLQRDLLLKTAIEEGKLKVVGAKYDLTSGKVDWFN